MTRFSATVTEFWARPFTGAMVFRNDRVRLIINPDLSTEERVTVLHTADNSPTAIAVLPEIADALARRGVHADASTLDESRLREALVEIGIVLHGADNLFYFPDGYHLPAPTEHETFVVRELTEADAARFAVFTDRATEQDLDDAQVELDDWAVFGVIIDDQIASVASTYPFRSSRLADIGVLTLASERGHGHARRLVHAMAQHAHEAGYELQYRCQLDNVGSNALANTAGLKLFGRWEAPTP